MVGVEVFSNWLQQLSNKGKSSYHIASGHAWLRFHRWAFMRFPSQDITSVDRTERHEMFFKAKALAISHQHLPDFDEAANATLYLCRDKDYDISKLSTNNRSKVRRGQKRMEVRRATRREVAESGYLCYYDTCTRQGIISISEAEFKAKWQKDDELLSQELWAAFADDEIAALGMVSLCGKWAELLYTQSANKYLKDYSNHALFYTVLNDLLHREEIESVSYGLSSVQPNSKIDSLHQFKLSVNFEAIPVVRKIHVNPFLRIAFNQTTLAGARQLERIFPKARHVLAARGAFELMMNTNSATPAGEPDDSLRPIEPRDAKEIATLHRQVFPDYSSTKLGLNFCTELYRSYATTEGAFGFVIRRGGECAGFVVGGNKATHNQINRELRGKAAAAMLWRPGLAVKAAVEKLSKFLPKAKLAPKTLTPSAKKNDKNRAAKLILIGVKEIARGTGAATELMQAFRSEAARRGFETIVLIVRRDNARARAAYEKAGWVLIDKGGESVEYYIAASS